jgi:hypothetical protein
MGLQDMPIQSTPKEVNPGDVALLPGERIYEDICQRLLGEVRARIDQRIADIEAQAVASEQVDSGELAAVGDEHASVHRPARRRPLLHVAISVVASAGLVGAVVTLARTQTEAVTSVTSRRDAASQSVRESLPKLGSTGGPETSTASSSFDVAQTGPSASPLGDAAAARSGGPSSAMAEAPPERDGPSAAERDLAPLIEKIAHDVGELQVGLQDLKASQEQASRDQTRAIEQLQAGQDHLARAFRAARSEAPPGGATAVRPAPRPALARAPRFQ